MALATRVAPLTAFIPGIRFRLCWAPRDTFLIPTLPSPQTFRRIKSRSAHLKWHGGGFNGDAKALQAASWPPRCDEVESGYPPATPALLTPTAAAAATQRQLVSLDEPQAPPTPMPSVSVGDRVLLRQSSSEGIVTLQRVKVVEVIDPSRCNVMLEDSGRLRADVQRQHVMHAIPLRHAEVSTTVWGYMK